MKAVKRVWYEKCYEIMHMNNYAFIVLMNWALIYNKQVLVSANFITQKSVIIYEPQKKALIL